MNLRTRRRMLEAAIPRLAAQGLAPGLLDDVIAATGCEPDRARLYFGRDEDLVMALYLRLAGELEALASDLMPGTVAERFHAVLSAKLALAEPYRAALAALLATLLDPRHELGVLSAQTELVRSRVRGVFAAALAGASDAPSLPAPTVERALYAAHLALMLLWTQDRSLDGTATWAALDLMRDLLTLVGPALPMLETLPGLDRVDGVFQAFLEPEPDAAVTGLAREILKRLFRHRRLLPGAGDCAETPCEACLALHLGRVRRSVLLNEPVHLLLPAFPAKSPSPEKVLGTLPDKAEEIALQHLQAVCEEIAAIYPPGAWLTICSDGRVFSDLVGVSDDDVTAYGAEIRAMIDRLGLRSLDTFGMEDLYETPDYGAMREGLIEHYAEAAEVLEERARTQRSHRALLDGIERFLFEERPPDDAGRSKTQIRKECHVRAFEVVRRSDAWGRLIAECFPLALRLSIHPQPAHSEKIGMLLGDAADVWITPWHGVAVRQDGHWTLMKRREAEAKGGEIVWEEGRPSFFALPATQ
jgi:pyoverdine/dityrosine biosynthesis protein Dit1